jgi:outer membrane lipopolysaccharide assembly protein LptE/RlpB
MKTTLLTAAALSVCALLGACGGGADAGVEVRPPVAEEDRAKDPQSEMMDSLRNN